MENPYASEWSRISGIASSVRQAQESVERLEEEARIMKAQAQSIPVERDENGNDINESLRESMRTQAQEAARQLQSARKDLKYAISSAHNLASLYRQQQREYEEKAKKTAKAGGDFGKLAGYRFGASTASEAQRLTNQREKHYRDHVKVLSSLICAAERAAEGVEPTQNTSEIADRGTFQKSESNSRQIKKTNNTASTSTKKTTAFDSKTNHGISYSRGFSKENNPQLSSRELSQLICSSVMIDALESYINDWHLYGENSNTSLDFTDYSIENSHYLNSDKANSVRNINKSRYQNAGELAKNDKSGRLFTNHKEGHVKMVADKSLEAADAIKDSLRKGSNSNRDTILNENIDKTTLTAAALSHDTGMCGGGYALKPLLGKYNKQLKDRNGKKMYEKDSDGNYIVIAENNDDFDIVRDNHSLNSAINVLSNRRQYLDAGYTNEQIDKIAVECMAHSKSSSGIKDLDSKTDWSDCFDRIECTVNAYNKDHPDSTIAFDRAPFENNNAKLGSLATETLALRIGDVSRDSGPNAEAQSGEIVLVDRASLNNTAGTIEGELQDARITIGNYREPVTSIKSRQVHVGEQNIRLNRTYMSSYGVLTHEITVNDGISAPKCTQAAILDHIGEFASAGKLEFNLVIRFDKPNINIKSYRQFRNETVVSNLRSIILVYNQGGVSD